MARNFKDFLGAFQEYADDGFCPPQFNLWSGISVVAGALERKVWLQWSPTLSYYPNMYVLLVGLPGSGKSTALNRAVNLINQLYAEGTVSLIPTQVTEAKFIELIGEKRAFEEGNRVTYQSAGYYSASEASNSLKEIYGDITACMTDFYDCPPLWEKATKKDGRFTLENVCFNLLAGSTFDYLGKLITDDNILGGFASRLTYVVSADESVKLQKFRYDVGGVSKEKEDYRQALLADLRQINRMVGAFRAEKSFGDAWETWDAEFQERRIAMKSEKMKSLLVRTNTSVYKLSMILAASESSSLVLHERHLTRAVELMKETEDSLPDTFRASKSSQVNSTDGLKSAFFHAFAKSKKRAEQEIRMELLLNNFDANRMNATLDEWISSGILGRSIEGSTVFLHLLVDPNKHL